ncbi:ABC transporter permease [Actinomyces viscosus]|uniref:ABC-type transport system involved in multi-copper enzyme maturation, permease component n=1 Tax=Actinomyces viscosus TaxID=1656 RepID=A0A448PK10_ACTVI|nr:ABC transporter permease [Actinomyces viscosus]TFH54195.1 ABC transporter permease [Actinomyces viscosus]VEI15494.1 ABC-type transport system involved in multi-copper enzyme maturation, permease component [Actinomyces viscosus]
MSAQTRPITRRQEIALVAGRELRAHLMKKSTIILTLILLVAVIGGIIATSFYTSGQSQAYRLGLKGIETSQAAGLDGVVSSNGEKIEVVDVSEQETKAVLSDDSPEGTPHVDMVLDVSGAAPTITVEEKTDDAVVSGVTAFLQQASLGQQIAALGGDPSQVASQLSAAKPEVTVLNAPKHDAADFGPRYAILMTIDVLLLFAIMGGGQFIAQGVVEEKSSRIVEILLACVRPSSLLAGKILGIGIASFLTTGVVAVAGVVTAKATGVMPDIDLDLDGVLAAMLVWLLVGYAIFAVAFGAAASLVSRQEDVSSVTMPLVMLSMVPYVLSFVMATGEPNSLTFRVLAFLPPFAPFMMPARLVLGVSSWTEQAIALGIALVFLPLLVRAAAAVYTRAVTRTGARVPLKELLGQAQRA